jgi:apoptotic chromatin condensation inducer in the nucleus
MMDEPVRIKDASAALEPPSQIIYIRGLTRPFTLPLLKELLSRYGTLVDGEFWLDKIKSQCFVTVRNFSPRICQPCSDLSSPFQYTTLEDAQNAREGLDGCRWPSTNPKTLSVRFAREDEVKFVRYEKYAFGVPVFFCSSNSAKPMT